MVLCRAVRSQTNSFSSLSPFLLVGPQSRTAPAFHTLYVTSMKYRPQPPIIRCAINQAFLVPQSATCMSCYEAYMRAHGVLHEDSLSGSLLTRRLNLRYVYLTADFIVPAVDQGDLTMRGISPVVSWTPAAPVFVFLQ